MNTTLALAATVGAYLTVGPVAATLIVAAAAVLVSLIATITMVAIFGSERRQHAALAVLRLLLDLRLDREIRSERSERSLPPPDPPEQS
ncbi:hypothetical protein [Spirillospora sp. NPDC048819]|uniref:hypothetical protein n=1 Tax=Spirillospora sp. NPDC048819 TaxID=3155268 RepID=UPI0033FA869C